MNLLVFGTGSQSNPNTSPYGRWLSFPPIGTWPPPVAPGGHYLDETDTGSRWDFTLTGPDTFTMTMTPFDTSFAPFSHSGTLDLGPGNIHAGKAINWIEFEFYNTDSHPAFDTDWHIRKMEVTGEAVGGVPADYNNNGVVDGADYVLWRNGGSLHNEVDKTGTIDAADYTEWRARFGNTAGAGLSQGAVPEPGWPVIIVAAAGLLVPVRSRGCERQRP
jgi:hypothetical protein